jgi:hypothetical protein
LESKRAFAVAAERATPKFDDGDETQLCTRDVTSMVTYCPCAVFEMGNVATDAPSVGRFA